MAARVSLSRVRSLLILPAALSTMVLLVAVSVIPFFTPLWIYPAQTRADSDGWTGWPIESVHRVTGEVLVDLIVGPPDFDQTVDGAVVFTDAERGHLRDVRSAVLGFAALALGALAVLVLCALAGRGIHAVRRGIRAGALGTAIGVIAAGATAIVAFDSAFELFHLALFPPGTYSFDPATSRLVQLFPMAFWQETAVAIGALIVVLSLLVMWLAARGLPQPDKANKAAKAKTNAPASGGAPTGS
jgi:integral membrane protein (TIGR01906 family)